MSDNRSASTSDAHTITELHHLRARLRALEAQLAQERGGREALFRMAVEQLPAVLWTTDRELRFTSSLGVGLRGLGLEPDGVVGVAVSVLRTDPGAEVTLDAHRRALQGESVTYDDSFAGRTFRSRVEPLRDAEGRIIGCIGLAHDITDLRRAEDQLRDLNAQLEHRVVERTAELRQSEALFRAVSEQMPDALFLVDLDDDPPGRILLTNEAAARALGWRVEELLGRSVLELEDPATRWEAAWRVPKLREGATLTFEGNLVRRDGSLLPLEASVRGVDYGGRRVAVAICRDLTQRRETEQRLRLVQSAVEQVADAVTITDADLQRPGPQIIYVNPAFERMTGYSREEVIGQSPRILQGPRTDRAVLDRMRDRLSRGEIFQAETYNYRKDGSEFILEWRVAPIRDWRGRVAYFVAIQRDVTHQRRAEELAEQHRCELAHVTRLSTMGEMASGLAHELNQPLAAIANYARGCLRRIERGAITPDETREAMDHVATQAERAAQIIQRLRRFVRKREPKRSTTELNELVFEALALMESEARHRQVRVRFEPARRLPRVLTDPIQIEQVIVNLVRNAIEAMGGQPPAEREVQIACRACPERMVELTVRDRGPGATAEELQRIFDPFYTTKPSGMGMGLPISRTIVEAHGGRLWATPNSDRGLTFHLTLPILRA